MLMEKTAEKTAVEATAPPDDETPRDARRVSAGNIAYRYALVFVWVAMAIVFAILRPETFPTSATIQTVFGSQSVLVVLTLALLVTLAVGEFDLSVASTLGLSATLIAKLNALEHWPLGVTVLVALVGGILVGLVNGFLVVYIGVDAIVATLGMGTLLLGIALAISNSVTIGGIDQTLLDAANQHFLGLPRSFWYGIVLAAIFWYVLQHTPLGRHLLFVGQNRDVSRLAGIRVDRIRLGAFVATGFLSALAGVILAGTLGAFQSSVAPTYLLPAFAAAFLGSTVVMPGRFNPWGSVIAIYFLITGITGLQLLGLSGWIEQVFYGGALIVAVTLSTLVRRRVVD
jgi:ribose transport system permease protein